MASTAKRRASAKNDRDGSTVNRKSIANGAATDFFAGAPGDVVYVAGAPAAGGNGNGVRAFPLVKRAKGEAEDAHLARVAGLVDTVIREGGTHLVVPRKAADWLADNPLLAEYFVNHHDLATASADAGIVFALRAQDATDIDFAVEVEGWQVVPGEGVVLVAERRLVAPRVTLRPRQRTEKAVRCQIVLAAKRVRAVRLRLALSRLDQRRDQEPQVREVALDLAGVGIMFHDLPYVAAEAQADGSLRLDFDVKLSHGRSVESIALELVQPDNWRVHPGFPGGETLALPAAVRAGARLELREMTLAPAARARKGPPHGTIRGARAAPYRKARSRPRDAVIFSSWVPTEGLVLGDYFLETLARWHGDSKLFVGVNHGSSPKWSERLRRSGLDVTIAPAGPDLTLPFDPSGFVAALDAYRRSDELFDLVWFGHNKGGDHLANHAYATARWMLERTFWSRRATIEGYFDDPVIGLYAPHYLMMLQQHLTQTEALTRMYQAPCAPLCAMAVSTHFVMRDATVREFCARVDKRFFRYGPEPFGGDRYFFEMAMPNVPIMQGYEPYIEPGLGGTLGQPKVDGVQSILSDWRQNHAVVTIELDKWRQDPTHFRTRHAEHNSVP
jgi:hypothetical protein